MAEYIRGMKHPVTSEPLAIHHIQLPPGSIVSIPAHMPHYVAPRRRGTGMLGSVATYRQPDPKRRFAPSPGRFLTVGREEAGEQRRSLREYSGQ